MNTWAAAGHAIGTTNLLFDKSQTPHCKSPEIFAFFGVSASNGQARSKQLRDLMAVDYFALWFPMTETTFSAASKSTGGLTWW